MIQRYIDGVLSGTIVVGELVRAAVERHVADLDRQSSPDFPYHFDERTAAVCVEFFPLMLKHSIGEFAGMEFLLEPWQAFGVWAIFGWKQDDNNSRRFRRVYWSTGRKNGKSTWVAGVTLLCASADVNPTTGKPESVADCILCATKKEQVEKVTYAEIERMRLQSQWIKDISTSQNKQVTFGHNHSTIRCVGSDRPYDGLNPHLVAKDELHAWSEYHRKFYDTITTGGASRTQPLDITTSTAGDDRSNLWNEEHDYAEAVVRGEHSDERLFVWSFEIDEADDPLDERVWVKANPNLGISVKHEYLRAEADRAKESRISLNRFTRYHGNRKVSSIERAFDLAEWDACEGELSDWHEADAIGGGIDLGSRDDLAAWGLVARFLTDEESADGQPVYRYELRTQCYIADDSRRDLTKEPFARWVYTRELIKSRTPNANLRSDFLELVNEYGVSDVAYDPYNGQIIGEEISSEGVPIARMAQTYQMFHEPINSFQQAMAEGRLRHNGSPLLRWQLNNAVLISDPQDRHMFCKRDSSEKIDAVVALVMAFWRASVCVARLEGAKFL